MPDELCGPCRDDNGTHKGPCTCQPGITVEDALRAEVAMLRETLAGIVAVIEAGSEICLWVESLGKARAALSASSSDWLARHDAEKDARIGRLEMELQASRAGHRTMHGCYETELSARKSAEAERDALRTEYETLRVGLAAVAQDSLASAQRDAAVRKAALLEVAGIAKRHRSECMHPPGRTGAHGRGADNG